MNTERFCSLTCSCKKPKSIIMEQNFPFFTVCTWKQEHLALQPVLAAALLSISTWQTETNGDWLPQVGHKMKNALITRSYTDLLVSVGTQHQAGHHKHNLLFCLHFFVRLFFFSVWSKNMWCICRVACATSKNIWTSWKHTPNLDNSTQNTGIDQ